MEEGGPPLPEHLELREIAVAMEAAGLSGEILDADWKVVFVSTEEARIIGVDPDEVQRFYGKSLLVRQVEDEEHWGITDEVTRSWWRENVPIMRAYLEPGDPVFDEVFGPFAQNAARVAPIDRPPRAWQHHYDFPDERQLRRSVLGEVSFLDMRIDDSSGQMIGVVRLARTGLPDALLARLGRGDRGLFERMDNVREPARRPAAILFADLASSSTLARRLSSRGYFELISTITGLIDTEVVTRRGIVGKHAGDGGSALFLAADFDEGESAAARAAIEAARTIRDSAAALGPQDVEVKLNVGLHWGATLMVGQVATTGRLEVTALGDQMNECARIEAAAQDGTILASKEIVERLNRDDARAAGVDPDALAYTPLGELEGVGEKAVRDAGTIPVTVL